MDEAHGLLNSQLTREYRYAPLSPEMEEYQVRGNSQEGGTADVEIDACTEYGNKRNCTAYLRYVTVEPILFGSSFIIAMYWMLGREYVYAQTAKKYGLVENGTNETCGSYVNTSDTQYLLQAKVSAETSDWILYLNIATFGASTFSVTLLGPWSDIVGRKIPMLMGLFGLLFLIIVYVLVINLTLPIPVLLLGHLICGLLGDYSMVLASSYSHIADISDEGRRTFRIAVADFTLGIAGFISSAVGGIWLDAQGFKNPFWLLLAVAVFNIIYTSLRFESTMEGSLLRNLKDLAMFRTLVHIYDVIKWNGGGTGRRSSMLLYTVCYFLGVMVSAGIQDVLLVYEIGVPFCWSPVLAGYSSAFAQCGNIVNMFLIRIYRGLKSELRLVMLGVVANLAFCTTLAFATVSWHILLAQCFQLFTTIIYPVLKSQMSRLVSVDEVGSVFSLLEISRNIGALVASFVFNGIFSATIDSSFPGAVFLVGDGVYLLYFSLFWIAFRCSKSTFLLRMEGEADREQIINETDC